MVKNQTEPPERPDGPDGADGADRTDRADPVDRVAVTVHEVRGATVAERVDRVAVEEPLEIRLAAGGDRRTLAITMRTPGADRELAVGFLYGEGLIRDRALIAAVECFAEEIESIENEAEAGGAQETSTRDVVEVELAVRRLPALRSLERHFFTGSACGVCGRASLDEMLVAGCEPALPGPVFSRSVICSFPEELRRAQSAFEATGGLHAAALFDVAGRRLAIHEDVGRHNALDKLIGRSVLDGTLGPESPLADRAVMVSGRASFELLQKCVAAGAPMLCAVSAPSSLAVEIARRFRVTLVAFLRGERFNVYSEPGRIGDG